MCGGLYGHVCTHACGVLRLMLGIISTLLPYSVKQSLSVKPRVPNMAGPTSQLDLGDSPGLCLLRLELRRTAHPPGICIGSGDPNLGPQGKCLITKSSPQVHC